jgi:hypothetical protein
MYDAEANLLKDVKKWAEGQRGIMMLRICDRYAKGYSDLFINAHGRFVVAELKDDTGTALPHQKLFIEDMQRCGAAGGVCRTVQEVVSLVDIATRCKCGTRSTEWKYCPYCGKLLCQT